MSELKEFKHLKKGNRVIVTDYYVPGNVEDDQQSMKFKVFVRLNAKKIIFRNVSFLHCIFDGCYIYNCTFDSCDFTGCRFSGSNFHQTAFKGCNFLYATFEQCQIDNDILLSEAPREENLRMHFARSLRVNYQQVGDAKAANVAINVELEATSKYLFKSWKSKETYYKEKYPGLLKSAVQFLRWIRFWVLHFIWGNGESILKLARTIFITLVFIAVYDTWKNGDPLDLSVYWANFLRSPSIFIGVTDNPIGFSTRALTIISSVMLVSLALFTTLLVKRFSRR